ncbi:hypothetical protein DL96DRAFT_1704533 [Flagelloscypha sp. PMI_526]|nr:hypothetical protein DL96DRAFT_1704533 [Flagelloscypha sp. PMI_526]
MYGGFVYNVTNSRAANSMVLGLSHGLLARPLDSNVTTRGEAVKNAGMAATLPESTKTIISRVEEVSKKKGWTMAQVTLAWINYGAPHRTKIRSCE